MKEGNNELPRGLTCFGPNTDFANALVENGADFLVIGGQAVAFHGCRDPNAVDDLDLLINPTEQNARIILATLSGLGHPLECSAKELVAPYVQIGCKGYFYLDILTPPQGVDYEALQRRSHPASIVGVSVRIPVRVPSLEDLIVLKKIALVHAETNSEKHHNDLRCLEARER